MISKAVKSYYEKLMNDWRVNSFFKNVNMPRLLENQKKFLIQGFGGPKLYQGRDMHSSHSSMNLRMQEFDITREHLIKAFSEQNVIFFFSQKSY